MHFIDKCKKCGKKFKNTTERKEWYDYGCYCKKCSNEIEEDILKEIEYEEYMDACGGRELFL